MKTNELAEMGRKAKIAALTLASSPTTQKDQALSEMIEHLKKHEEEILNANFLDVEEGKKKGLSSAMLDRLSLDGRMEGIREELKNVGKLPDPIGETFDANTLANGLNIQKQRVPLGVLGVIYEARPNVTVDVAALAIKTGNAAILRGGSETLRTNIKLVEAIQTALKHVDLPSDAIQLISSPDRSLVKEMLTLPESIDLIIPRGGAKLHQFCRENSMIPVITGGIGVCHLYVTPSADQDKSIEVVYNAKTQRPTVCNSLDTLLINKQIAPSFLPKLMDRLAKAEVSFRFDDASWKLLSEEQKKLGKQSKPEDWDTEWLNLTLGIKLVEDIKEAMAHIQTHSTGHSDGILTENKEEAAQFIKTIDSSAVYVNASTRFTDGSQLGLGAEVAISTQKIHARGPMGLKELTSYKWIIEGNYTTRS